jgi:hypothetical protein
LIRFNCFDSLLVASNKPQLIVVPEWWLGWLCVGATKHGCGAAGASPPVCVAEGVCLPWLLLLLCA